MHLAWILDTFRIHFEKMSDVFWLKKNIMYFREFDHAKYKFFFTCSYLMLSQILVMFLE